MPRYTWKHRGLALWRNWVRPILLVIVVLGSFRSAVADWNDVPSPSMNPAILAGDRIFVNKLAYGLRVPLMPWYVATWDGPQRGDTVVFFGPDSGVRMVKRVVGVPGDRVALRGNRLYVNDSPAAYRPVRPGEAEVLADGAFVASQVVMEQLGGREHPILLEAGLGAPSSFGPMTVPEGHYFMMGDNRNNSRDSRVFGCVPREAIVGRATSVVFSRDPDRWGLPRWDRFFHDLP